MNDTTTRLNLILLEVRRALEEAGLGRLLEEVSEQEIRFSFNVGTWGEISNSHHASAVVVLAWAMRRYWDHKGRLVLSGMALDPIREAGLKVVLEERRFTFARLRRWPSRSVFPVASFDNP